MTNKELKLILEKHQKWLNDEEGGERAILRGADLSYADLCGADLYGADLSYADLYGAILRGADLSYADLYGAILRGAILRGADLSYADLCGADLYGANLSYADLENIKVNTTTSGYHLVCPEKGSFIGFKKVDNYIIELKIPSKAKRSSATSRKCRCEFAKVLSITKLDGRDSGLTEIVNRNYKETIYKIGEMVYPDSFDVCRWNECGNGIHFFITRQEAVDYN